MDINDSTALAARLATRLHEQILTEINAAIPGDGLLERASRMATIVTTLAMLNAKAALASAPRQETALEACDRIALVAKIAIRSGNTGWDGT